MGSFKVDNEQIDAVVDIMKELITKCEDIYKKKIPTSGSAKGQTCEELISVCDNIRITSCYFGQLIHNTIEFLGQSSELFEQSEMSSARAVREGENANGGGII